MTNHDHIGATLKNTATLPMPAGLADKIMASVEKEMAQQPVTVVTSKPAWMNYAAAVAILALGITAFVVTQSPDNVVATQNPPVIEESIPETGVETTGEITVAEAPVNEAIEKPVAAEEPVTLAEQDVMTISQVTNPATSSPVSGGGNYLSDIGADPLADESIAEDPVMMLVGF